MTSPTTHKGNIGQTAVALEALQRGYHPSIPFEGAPYDLVIDKGEKLFKIQVKYAESENGLLKIRLRDYQPCQIDAIIAYDHITRTTYWLPIERIGGAYTISLRLVAPKNMQSKDIIWASEFVQW